MGLILRKRKFKLGHLGWLGGNESASGNFWGLFDPCRKLGDEEDEGPGEAQEGLCTLTGWEGSPVPLEREGKRDNQRNNLNWSTQTKSTLLERVMV